MFRIPDFMKIGIKKVVGLSVLCTGHLYSPSEIFLVLIPVRG